MASTDETYLIVGAGIFGVSTALHLKQQKPSAKIILIDRTPFPNPASASHDTNKIVRADYADIFYMELALEALEEWRGNFVFQPHFHQTGIIFAETNGTGKAAIKNYKTLGLDVPAIMLSLEDAQGRWRGAFKKANWEGAEEIYWNKESGYADAEEALRATTQAAISKGVIYREATVSELILENGTCTGVRTNNGKFYADHTVLCTGAYTAQLLADSAPGKDELQVNGRLVAAGAVSGTAKISPELNENIKDAPVLFNGLPHTHGESLPVNRKGLVKFNCEDSFTRMKYRPFSEQKISVPPSEKYSTWGSGENVPKGLRDGLDTVARNTYGDGVWVDSYRMCWDSVTPDQDFLICEHPHCGSLYLVTGGSFHAFKFLPTIGKYVVKMVDGTLEEKYKNRWAWDREYKGTACVMYAPRRDIKDINGPALDGL